MKPQALALALALALAACTHSAEPTPEPSAVELSPREQAKEVLREELAPLADATDTQLDTLADSACRRLDTSNNVNDAVAAVAIQVLTPTDYDDLHDLRLAAGLITMYAANFNCSKHQEEVSDWVEKETS